MGKGKKIKSIMDNFTQSLNKSLKGENPGEEIKKAVQDIVKQFNPQGFNNKK